MPRPDRRSSSRELLELLLAISNSSDYFLVTMFDATLIYESVNLILVPLYSLKVPST
jgi:hypothetical protein